MKLFDINNDFKKLFYICGFFMILSWSCDDTFLKEVPLDQLNQNQLVKTKEGFENYITALHEGARQEVTSPDLNNYCNMFCGTDVVTTGQLSSTNFVNYESYLTPYTDASEIYWNWAYEVMIPRANAIIDNAEKEEMNGIWDNEAEKNAIIAEAKFFRAYTYNILANLYGGVPIVDRPHTSPKVDFERATREEVYKFASEDLEFASEWLPLDVDATLDGRIVKGAADHLLAEVYISLGEYDKAIESASRVINSGGVYTLMTERFGVNKDQPGDVFSDLFIQGNQNRSSGNLESLFVLQFEDEVEGGEGNNYGNNMPRLWLPFWVQLKDPKGVLGIVCNDSIGRGVAICRPTTYFLYDLWADDWNDMRNSRFNIRRDHYYNNPKSKYFGQKVGPRTTEIDTMQRIYPAITKAEGKAWADKFTGGRISKDMIIYRVGETYLLRAEAYFRKGSLVNAANDINILRQRANASLVESGDITIDFILDERARELIAEERRRRTLMRMGKLVERVKKYNMKEETRNSISEKHELYPIPQTAIDANFGNEMEQNAGY